MSSRKVIGCLLVLVVTAFCTSASDQNDVISRIRRQCRPGRRRCPRPPRPGFGPPGQGFGPPPGQGFGPPPGQGFGPPPGQGFGPPPGQGFGPPPGQGFGRPPGQGFGGPPGQGQGQSATEPTDVVNTALSQARANTCKSTGYTCTANRCGQGLSSLFEERVEGQWRILIANGIPNHPYNTGAQRPNPNQACVHNSYMKVPLNPTKGGFTPSGLGPVGIAFSGGFFYNHLSSPRGDVAEFVEGVSFDKCFGHADPQCRYHYHKVPTCLDPGNSCKLVGYMMDGFPVYSFCTINGVRLRSCYKQVSGDGSLQTHFEYRPDDTCHLDEANGFDLGHEIGYAYVFSENYPFVMRGFMGSTVYSICEVY